jgi:propanol-preferring alcohol dehydrogenase
MKSPTTMMAMVLESIKEPLRYKELAIPIPLPDQILIKIHACGVCRTDLHIVDGELPKPKLPLILGHQIVGTVMSPGKSVKGFQLGDKVGISWLGYTDGTCPYCMSERENLCDSPLFTGYTIDGGYAQYTVADHRYCFPIPEGYSDVEAAPLLCAGLIGYRSYRLAIKDGDVMRLGIYGFGAAAHIITQIAVYKGKEIYAFTRPGDRNAQDFALHMGAIWAGDSNMKPPRCLDAAIIFAPIGSLIPIALKATAKGGTVVSGGIHMSEIPSFSYEILWEERVIRSVANMTRKDGDEFLKMAPSVPIKINVTTFELEEANLALQSLRRGKIEGSAVLRIDN